MAGLPPVTDEPAAPEGGDPLAPLGSAASLPEHPTPPAAMPKRPRTNVGNCRRFVFICVAFGMQKPELDESGS
jgi:hypothetical protein